MYLICPCLCKSKPKNHSTTLQNQQNDRKKNDIRQPERKASEKYLENTAPYVKETTKTTGVPQQALFGNFFINQEKQVEQNDMVKKNFNVLNNAYSKKPPNIKFIADQIKSLTGTQHLPGFSLTPNQTDTIQNISKSLIETAPLDDYHTVTALISGLSTTNAVEFLSKKDPIKTPLFQTKEWKSLKHWQSVYAPIISKMDPESQASILKTLLPNSKKTPEIINVLQSNLSDSPSFLKKLILLFTELHQTNKDQQIDTLTALLHPLKSSAPPFEKDTQHIRTELLKFNLDEVSELTFAHTLSEYLNHYSNELKPILESTQLHQKTTNSPIILSAFDFKIDAQDKVIILEGGGGDHFGSTGLTELYKSIYDQFPSKSLPEKLQAPRTNISTLMKYHMTNNLLKREKINPSEHYHNLIHTHFNEARSKSIDLNLWKNGTLLLPWSSQSLFPFVMNNKHLTRQLMGDVMAAGFSIKGDELEFSKKKDEFLQQCESDKFVFKEAKGARGQQVHILDIEHLIGSKTLDQLLNVIDSKESEFTTHPFDKKANKDQYYIIEKCIENPKQDREKTFRTICTMHNKKLHYAKFDNSGTKKIPTTYTKLAAQKKIRVSTQYTQPCLYF